MKKSALLFLVFFSVFSLIILTQFPNSETKLEIVLDKSGPYIGATYAKNLGYDGSGIVIGVIDTGIFIVSIDSRKRSRFRTVRVSFRSQHTDMI